MSRLSFGVEVAAVSVDREDEIFHATATSGRSLQLACDVQFAQQLVWTRLAASLQHVPKFKASSTVYKHESESLRRQLAVETARFVVEFSRCSRIRISQ